MGDVGDVDGWEIVGEGGRDRRPSIASIDEADEDFGFGFVGVGFVNDGIVDFAAFVGDIFSFAPANLRSLSLVT